MGTPPRADIKQEHVSDDEDAADSAARGVATAAAVAAAATAGVEDRTAPDSDVVPLCQECGDQPAFVGSDFCGRECKAAAAAARHAHARDAAAVSATALIEHPALCALQGCWREALVLNAEGESVELKYCCRNHAVASQPEFSAGASRVAAEWGKFGERVPWKQSKANGVVCDLPDCTALAHFSKLAVGRVHHCCRRHAEIDVLRGLTDLDPTKIGSAACVSAVAFHFWQSAPDGPVSTRDRDRPRKKRCALSGCFRPSFVSARGRDCKFCCKDHAAEGTRSGQYRSTLWRPDWKGPTHAFSHDPRRGSTAAAPVAEPEPDDADDDDDAVSVASRSSSRSDGTDLERALQARLDEQGRVLAELRAEVRASSAKAGDGDDGGDDGDDEGPEGPFAPHYWERDGAVQNPHRPLRDRLISECPHLYTIKDAQNEYVKVLRTRKGQGYHEYLTLTCATSYYWDGNAYLDEVTAKLVVGGTAEEQVEKLAIVDTLKNQHREIYGLLNRRKYNIELRTRINFKELENDAEDESILAEIDRRCDGFRSGTADMAEVDPYIRRWISQLRKKTDRATLTAVAKSTANKKGAAAKKDFAPRGNPKGGANKNKAAGTKPAAGAP